jgi:hypothetical protein
MNNGVWLVKNTPETHAVIVNIFNEKGNVNHPQADQLSLLSYLKHNPTFAKEHVWILPARAQFEWQAYPRTMAANPGRKPWMIHLAGFLMKDRKGIMAKYGLLCGEISPTERRAALLRSRER